MLPRNSHCNPASYECSWGQGKVWVKGGSDVGLQPAASASPALVAPALNPK
jgi:hypothetical protein